MASPRRPSWRGHLRLSLVTCPVALYSAIDPGGDVHFHLINPETGRRVRYKTVDAGTGEEVQRGELIKGYEISKGRYVTLSSEEINAVKLESTKTLDIEAFVPAEEIDRLYWDHPYFLAPDGNLAEEPFAVIRAAMERSGQVALGRVVMSTRERVLALEPRDGIIVATSLRSPDEVRDFAGIAPPPVKVSSEMVTIASRIMKQKAAHFEPAQFEDRYEEALRALIERKQRGQEILFVDEPEPQNDNVVDLMDALRKSLGERAPAAPKRRASPARRPAKKAPARKRRTS